MHVKDLYHRYIACLNEQNWPDLGTFVHDEVAYNDQYVGLSGYCDMLKNDFRQIPDLHFHIALLTTEPDLIASRLNFDCSPKGVFLGLPVNGQQVHFSENVFYELRDGKIARVWSVIDKAAIEAQLVAAPR